MPYRSPNTQASSHVPSHKGYRLSRTANSVKSVACIDAHRCANSLTPLLCRIICLNPPSKPIPDSQDIKAVYPLSAVSNRSEYHLKPALLTLVNIIFRQRHRWRIHRDALKDQLIYPGDFAKFLCLHTDVIKIKCFNRAFSRAFDKKCP